MEQNKNFYEELKQYFETTPREKVLEDWAKTAECDKVGPTVEEFLENTQETLEEGFKILEVYNSISTQKRKPDNEFGIGSFPQGYDTSVWYCTKVVRTSDNQLFVKDFTETNKGKVIGFRFYGDFENKKCIVITTLGDYKLSEIQLTEKMFSEEEVMDMFHNLSMHLPLHYESLVKEQFKKK